MYEPKYKLNKKDEARFAALVRREALGTISSAQAYELAVLHEKRHEKLARHPRMCEATRAATKAHLEQFKRLKDLTQRLKRSKLAKTAEGRVWLDELSAFSERHGGAR